jgi:hypothetical protein
MMTVNRWRSPTAMLAGALLVLVALGGVGCAQFGGAEINPFLTLTESFGGVSSPIDGGGGARVVREARSGRRAFVVT